MGGSREQGLKAAATNKERYGLNYYKKLGKKGGEAGGGGNVWRNNPELAREAGRKGGATPRRERKPSNTNQGPTGALYESLSPEYRKTLAGLERVADYYRE